MSVQVEVFQKSQQANPKRHKRKEKEKEKEKDGNKPRHPGIVHCYEEWVRRMPSKVPNFFGNTNKYQAAR